MTAVTLTAAARRRSLLADIRIPGAPLHGLLAALCAVGRRLGFRAARGEAGPSPLATARVPS